MSTFLIVGGMMVIGVLIMMGRLNLRRFLGYPNLVDISFTLLMLWVFAGTFSGMVAGGFASLFMSVVLWVLRGTIGAERLAVRKGVKRVRFFNVAYPTLYWRTIKASECQPHWLVKLTANIFKARTI